MKRLAALLLAFGLAFASLAHATTKTIALTSVGFPATGVTTTFHSSSTVCGSGSTPWPCVTITALSTGSITLGEVLEATSLPNTPPTYISGACTGSVPTMGCPINQNPTGTQSTPIATTVQNGYLIPADWNASNNTVTCIGAGGAGFLDITASTGGGGGGSGVYAPISNISPTIGGYYPYFIGVGGGTATSAGTASTWFWSLAANGTSSSSGCGARGGSTATTTSGGGGGSLTGGTPGISPAVAGVAGGGAGSSRGGGGGGGTPGPDGVGTAGASAGAGSFGAGGNADGNSANNTANLGATGASGAGGNGTFWSLTAGGTAGLGGGGAGGPFSVGNGGNAGAYGAGGGGAFIGSSAAGTGGNGLIIVQYTLSVAGGSCTRSLLGVGC